MNQSSAVMAGTLPAPMIAQARSGTRVARRRRLIRRTSALVACAAVAFAAGAVVGARHTSSEQRAARAFASAWERGDFAAMYALLTREARRRIAATGFISAYRGATAIATTTGVDAGRPAREQDGVVSVPMQVRTRVFGTLHAALALPVKQEDGAARIDWRPHLVFPGM